MYRSRKKIKSLRNEIRGSVFFGNSTKRADSLFAHLVVDNVKGDVVYCYCEAELFLKS